MRLFAMLLWGLGLATPSTRAEDLLAIYLLALKSDPVFLAAEANYNADKQLLGQARAALLPNLDATANSNWNDNRSTLTPPPPERRFNSSGYTISLNQKIFNWESFAALKQAKAEVRRAQATFNAARQDLIRRVAELYFGILMAADNLQLAQTEQSAVAHQLEVAQGRLDVGLGTITEVHDAKARHKLSEAQVLEARNKLEDSREALREATGVLAEQLHKLRKTIPLLQPDPPNIGQWTDTALKQNYSVIAARESVEISSREISQKNAGHYPSLDIVGSHSKLNSVSGFSGTEYESTNNSIGLELKLPIYQGGLIYRESKEARYRYQAAQQNLEAKRRSVVRATRDTYLGISSGASLVKALQQAVIASESALAAKTTGFEAGINTNLEVLDAQRDLYRTKRDYAQARYSYILNLLRLKLAAGTLGGNDLKEINGWLE